jgi:FdhD protein
MLATRDKIASRIGAGQLRQRRIAGKGFSHFQQSGENRAELRGACSKSVVGKVNGATTSWCLPEEVPLALQLNSAPYAVMMGTPADLEAFGLGFVLTEGLVERASDVANVLVIPSGEGFTIDLAITEGKLIRERMVSRSVAGRVGCGLCGVEDMADAIRMPKRELAAFRPNPQAVAYAFEALPRFQPMNALNHTVHAAAWCLPDGSILMSREDVGRHNALDKLIGAMTMEAVSSRDGFVLMSSRCSFELVQKCAMAGISALATVSAPTVLAHRLAKQAGMSLAAHSKQGVMIFEGDQDEIE